MFGFTLNTLLWLGLVVVFALLEAATVGLICVWFAAGAVAALITSALTPSWAVQIVVFLVISFGALAITRPLVKKNRLDKPHPTNTELNIGRKATVIVAVRPDFPGRVRLDGVDWAASGQVTLEEGDICLVTAVHGATLTVVEQPQPATVS